MVYFRIEMGLGKDPKENKCNATIARRLNGMSFAKAEAERIDKEQRHKTAYNYLTAVRSLTQFIGNDKWCFADITTSMLERYQRWLCNRGLRLNTVSVYMRTLRALYNRAVEDNGDSPFSAVFTGHERIRDTPIACTTARQPTASCHGARHIRVQLYGYGNAVCRHRLPEMAPDKRRRNALRTPQDRA